MEDFIWVAEIKCSQLDDADILVCSTIEEIRSTLEQLIPEDMDFAEMQGMDISISWTQMPVEEFDTLEEAEG